MHTVDSRALTGVTTEATGDMAYVNLSSMPSPKREYVVSFERLDGGLNLQELDYRIGNNETPEIKNLMWKDGVLGCRSGQVWVNDDSTEGDTFYAAYERLWNGKMIIHSGVKIYIVDPVENTRIAIYTGGSDMEHRGSFFSYNEKLYYKTRGYYVCITYDADTDEFSASDVSGYTPVTYINCSPINGSGTVYQPENRIGSNKTLWYNSAYTLTTTIAGDFSVSVEESYFRMRINTPGIYYFNYDGTAWTLNGVQINPLDFGILVGGTPVSGNIIEVNFAFMDTYYLPIKGADVPEVKVEGVSKYPERINTTITPATFTAELDDEVWRAKVTESGTYTFAYDYPTEKWYLNGDEVDIAEYGLTTGEPIYGCEVEIEYTRGDYWYDQEDGKITFFVAPKVFYPEINNTVQITYTQPNDLAMSNIMDCDIATVYGGTGALCVVMAGCLDQPNAYFWNGQTSIAMDPTYFPMTQYQLAGNAVDRITAFSKQQGYLIVFKERSIGRTSLETQTVNERLTIDLAYTAINAKIGCDLPQTVQLIENNLTWCNTQNGVHFLANTSAAYENNVINLSHKINESSNSWSPGLLYDVRNNGEETICSHDDEKRYWLIVNGHVWLWDYQISNYKNPSWFYFDNIYGRAFIQENTDLWHFDEKSRLTRFDPVYYDYDPSTDSNGAIHKVFRFATQYFGTYDNLKTVNSVIINTRSDTNSVINLRYLTDYESRDDLTPLMGVSWRLVPRNLEFRNLSGYGFAHVFRRKPHCRRIRYFTMRLENKTPTMDMSIVSAQIYYIFQGRQR